MGVSTHTQHTTEGVHGLSPCRSADQTVTTFLNHAALRAKILSGFEALPAESIKEAYGATSPITKFVKGDDKVYDSLREVAKVLKLDLTKLK